MFSEASVDNSVRNQPHGYLVTAHPCYSMVGIHPTGMLSCFKMRCIHEKPLVPDKKTDTINSQI